jgi:SAM-dependent methyltransferase
MKYRLLEWLACPQCRSEDLLLETVASEHGKTHHASWESSERDLPGLNHAERDLVDIQEGSLHCKDCGVIYPIREGVPRMLPADIQSGPSTAHRWTQFDGEAPEYEQNFQDMVAPLEAADALGQLILDAGCGFGRHAYFAARYGAEVVALDSSAEAVAATQANCGHLQRVHVVQGDLHHPPFRQDLFDTVFCFGVLHHLSDAHKAFGRLKPWVRPNGRLQVWVYGPRQGTIAHISKWLHSTANTMGDEQLLGFSKGIASCLRVFSHTPFRFLQHTPILKSIVTHLPAHDHHKWPFEVVVADVYDRLRVPVTTYITGETLERWFGDEGFADIQVVRRVRNSESFRGTGIRR